MKVGDAFLYYASGSWRRMEYLGSHPTRGLLFTNPFAGWHVLEMKQATFDLLTRAGDIEPDTEKEAMNFDSLDVMDPKGVDAHDYYCEECGLRLSIIIDEIGIDDEVVCPVCQETIPQRVSKIHYHVSSIVYREDEPIELNMQDIAADAAYDSARGK